MKKINNNQYFSEVIASSLQGWTAQCWQWNKFPQFGSVVVIESDSRELYGIVYQIQTGTIDSNRHIIAYQKTEEELLQEQPQIFEFLRTTFSCLMLGYKENGNIYHMLAPEPAKIHSFIRPINTEEAKQFFKDTQFLNIIFSQANLINSVDELLLALIKNLRDNNLLNSSILDEFIQSFSLLTNNDYRRLKLFLHRADLFLKELS